MRSGPRGTACTTAMTEARFEISDACGDATEASPARGIKRTCEGLQVAEGCVAEQMAADMVCE